mgnify:CR=1 FL=1
MDIITTTVITTITGTFRAFTVRPATAGTSRRDSIQAGSTTDSVILITAIMATTAAITAITAAITAITAITADTTAATAATTKLELVRIYTGPHDSSARFDRQGCRLWRDRFGGVENDDTTASTI